MSGPLQDVQWHISKESGPWNVHCDANGTSAYQTIRDVHTGEVVAFAVARNDELWSDPESEHIARLIVAAPELLAVAQLLALATDEGDDLAAGTHYIDKAGRIRAKGSFLDTIEKARAAIAKATGEAS